MQDAASQKRAIDLNRKFKSANLQLKHLDYA